MRRCLIASRGAKTQSSGYVPEKAGFSWRLHNSYCLICLMTIGRMKSTLCPELPEAVPIVNGGLLIIKFPVS